MDDDPVDVHITRPEGSAVGEFARLDVLVAAAPSCRPRCPSACKVGVLGPYPDRSGERRLGLTAGHPSSSSR